MVELPLKSGPDSHHNRSRKYFPKKPRESHRCTCRSPEEQIKSARGRTSASHISISKNQPVALSLYSLPPCHRVPVIINLHYSGKQQQVMKSSLNQHCGGP